MILIPNFNNLVFIHFHEFQCPFQILSLQTMVVNHLNLWINGNLSLVIAFHYMNMHGRMVF